jgi:biofilm protein TabA
MPLQSMQHKVFFNRKKGTPMVLDTLKNHHRYHALHPLFKAAFEFLQNPETLALPAGLTDIAGDRFFALVQHDMGKGRENGKLERHREYIDIQFTVSGIEVIGWRPVSACRSVTVPYGAEKDIGFFGDAPETWVTLPSGTFAVFFPWDAHAPLCGPGSLHKIVVKVKM